MPLEPKQGPSYYKVIPIGNTELGKVWQAVMAQTGTANPVISQLFRNNLGYELTWVRIAQGVYHATTEETLNAENVFTELTFQGDGQSFYASGQLILGDSTTFVLHTYYNGSLSDNVSRQTIKITIK